MSGSDTSYPTIKLKGNELEWIIKLATEYQQSEKWCLYVDKYNLKQLDKNLIGILMKFRPLNFPFGGSETTWILSYDTSPTTNTRVSSS